MKIFGMGTNSDFYDRYTWFYPNAHKMVLYQGFFFCWAENLKFVIFKEQLVLSEFLKKL